MFVCLCIRACVQVLVVVAYMEEFHVEVKHDCQNMLVLGYTPFFSKTLRTTKKLFGGFFFLIS